MCCSLGLSKSAEIICLCEQKLKKNQEFNCANPGKSPPISNKDNFDPETMSWYWEQKSNTGPRRSEAGKTKHEGRQGAALYGGKKALHYGWDMLMNKCDCEKGQQQI